MFVCTLQVGRCLTRRAGSQPPLLWSGDGKKVNRCRSHVSLLLERVKLAALFFFGEAFLAVPLVAAMKYSAEKPLPLEHLTVCRCAAAFRHQQLRHEDHLCL